MTNIIFKNNCIDNLNESIEYANNKNSNYQYPQLSNDDTASIGTLLIDYYTSSKIIALSYRDKGKIKSYVGIIDRIDLIHKELYLLPKKKIPFSTIVGLKK